MSTINSKILAEGKVPTALSVIYTAPVLTKAYVKYFSIFNTGGLTEDVYVYVTKNGSTSRLTGHVLLLPLEFALVVDKDETINLDAGDSISASTTNLNACDYVITGGEEV